MTMTEQNSASLIYGGAQKPRIIVNPPATITAASGADVPIESFARGQPNPTCQWQVSTNGGSTWADVEGATDPTYTLHAAGQNTYRYRAVYTSPGGTITTTVCILTLTPIQGASVHVRASTPAPVITGLH